MAQAAEQKKEATPNVTPMTGLLPRDQSTAIAKDPTPPSRETTNQNVQYPFGTI
jgi:hypothetical protein